jgi:nucleotide-binding universal stress UspA family protein
MFKTVLFPIDRSRESQQAATVVLELVKSLQSELHILSVVAADADDAAMASESAVESLLEEAKAMFAAEGIAAKILERSGKPAFTICDVADEINAEVIVMGSRGLGLTTEGATDSVAQKVLSLSPCPVLVIP